MPRSYGLVAFLLVPTPAGIVLGHDVTTRFSANSGGYHVYGRNNNKTERASSNFRDGGEGNDHGDSPAITVDGRFVAFSSIASDLIPGDVYNGEADAFMRGPFLTLEADPLLPPPAATLAFSTWTGQPSGAVLLAVTEINGAPTFLPALFSSFDAGGRITSSGTVPPGLTGYVVTFEAVGFETASSVGATNAITVAFQ